MVNNDSSELFAKLSKLSEQERKVLKLRCDGLDYKTIHERLFISVSAVKQYMSRVYVKLGLDLLSRAERMKVLYETFCPLLQRLEEIPAKLGAGTEAPETSEPVIPAYVPDMVDEDEYPLVPIAPTPLVAPKPNPKPGRFGLRGLVIGVVLGICLTAGTGYLVFQSDLLASRSKTEATPTTPIPAGDSTDVVSASPTPEEATQTPVIIEQVVVVTATPLPATLPPTQPPAPSIALPFSDNFDNGASPTWKVLSGNWLTVDGRYTTLPDDNGWQWSVLSDPTWKNYRVSVNIYLPHIFSANQGKIAIAARVSSSQPKYLSLYVDNIRTQAGWAFIGNDYSVYDYVSGPAEYVPESANIELEVRDNQFTARLNGRDIQTITLTGYEQGGAALGVYCDSTGCPSFDDFEIKAVSQ